MKRYKFKTIALELTRRCNMRCSHCMYGDGQDISMSHGIIDKVINDIEDVNTIFLEGGEPLLEIDTIAYLVEKISNSHLTTNYIELTTNGTIRDKSIIDIFESFCLNKDGNKVQINFSSDQYHNLDEYKKSLSFYEQLIMITNKRINQKFRNSMIKLYTMPQLNELRYAGRAKSLIENQNVRPAYGNLIYGHRIKILDGTIHCVIRINSNGNISFSEDVEYETSDKMSFGNIMNESLTESIINNNKNCLLLCSESEVLSVCHQITNQRNHPMNIEKALSEVRLELYKRILELRYKAKELFPNVLARNIIEAVPFPQSKELEMFLYKQIYKNSEYCNHTYLSLFSKQYYTRKEIMLFNSVLQVVSLCLKDRTTRRMPYYLLGNETDILSSIVFQKLRQENEKCCREYEDNINYACFSVNDYINYQPEVTTN